MSGQKRSDTDEMTFAVNDRASRVDMPAPDNTFGIYHVTN